MDEFLPGIYAQCDNDSNRYTYLNGSTAGGAVIYDNGRFLYSHHATDPCSGKLVNAFDLVRLHKFGDMDDSSAFNTPINRLPSYAAMCQFAIQDSAVSAALIQDRTQQAMTDFVDIINNRNGDTDSPVEDTPESDWKQRLQINPQTGIIKSTIDNLLIILENDSLLKGKFALNRFAGRGEVLGSLPWCYDSKRRLWADTDNNGVYWYMERVYGITGRDKIDSALDIHSSLHAFNEVQDYLNGLHWDGVPRLDTLFIDYLGAEENEYNRAVCRKAFTAAVARAMTPGCKYDNMLILCGPQGIGKSTILDKMSRGWFNDSIRTFEGKEASELLQGVWVVEVAELDAFRKTDVARIKQFLSLRSDRYRAAYGRNVKELPRCCVFFGTCNQSDFLQDTTGNRRFWPVDVGISKPARSVFKDLTDSEIDQVWAEAVARWQMGEILYLTDKIEEQARERQEQHREVSVKEGPILDFVAKQVPDDWAKWPIDRRYDFWAQTAHGEINLVERDRICALEVWCEVFHGSAKDIKNMDTREINAILANMRGWKRADRPLRFGPYGVQRGYIKI
jgi:predicted P-loop ATPase